MNGGLRGVRTLSLSRTLFLEACGVLDDGAATDLLLEFVREFRSQRLVVVDLPDVVTISETGVAVVREIQSRAESAGSRFLLGLAPEWIAHAVAVAPAGALPSSIADDVLAVAGSSIGIDGDDRGWYERWGKRSVDIGASTILLLMGLPVLMMVWVTLRVALGPDVVISQERVGRGGVTFPMYKFRTMRWTRRHEQATFDGDDRRQSHKVDTDPRHTPVGRLLRSISADELPQLVNVLVGSMSLVGPRPELASVVDRHAERSHRRHSIRPGMTGEWQIAGRTRGELLEESFDDDLAYLSRITFRNDLLILLRTVGVVLRRRGR